MTKEKLKAFVKDHKREITIGVMAIAGTVCAVVGVKGINKVVRNQFGSYKEAINGMNEFNDALYEAMSGCSDYVPVTYEELRSAAGNCSFGENLLRDPNGDIIEVQKFIAFGNKVEP